jgi:membrane-associated phospholipid phosphatase
MKKMSPDLPVSDKRALWLVLASLAAILALFILFQRFLFLPKILMAGLIFLGAALAGRVKPLVRDWFVFMAFIYLFDSLRGTIYILTCKLQLPAYALYVLNIEKALFGGIPSAALQKTLLQPDPLGNFTWLEKTLTVCYGSHFIAFLFVGFLIWLTRPKAFSLYKLSFYPLIFVGELIYALAPTVPPWMASSQFGLIPPLTRFNAILFNFAIPDLTSGFDTNPIAAMPSLHAGFPILCCLLLWGLYRWKAVPFYVYTLAVLFTIVYSGDHYVTDVLAGLVLAAACYALARRACKKRSALSGAADDGTDAGSSFGGAVMKKRVLAGLGVFLAGIVIGGLNKTQFVMSANSYNLDVPRYVDFFKNEDRYGDSYPVQSYFGNHYLAKHDPGTALRYFETSLALARNPMEKKETQMRISFCRQTLGLKN